MRTRDLQLLDSIVSKTCLCHHPRAPGDPFGKPLIQLSPVEAVHSATWLQLSAPPVSSGLGVSRVVAGCVQALAEGANLGRHFTMNATTISKGGQAAQDRHLKETQGSEVVAGMAFKRGRAFAGSPASGSE